MDFELVSSLTQLIWLGPKTVILNLSLREREGERGREREREGERGREIHLGNKSFKYRFSFIVLLSKPVDVIQLEENEIYSTGF
jgi:hypothetical protein